VKKRGNAEIVQNDVAMEDTNDTQRFLRSLPWRIESFKVNPHVRPCPGGSGKSTGSAKKKRKKGKSERPLIGFDPRRPAIVTLDSLGMPRYTTTSALK
jgi:hypothetical protein